MSTEKTPRLFYYEEAENSWCPADGWTPDNVIDDNMLEDGEVCEVRFKRVDMTDEEFEALPEI